jgi:hypothetical protein
LASSSIQTAADMVNTIANTHRLRPKPGAPGSPSAIAGGKRVPPPTPGEAIDQARRGIDRVHRTSHPAYSFLRPAPSQPFSSGFLRSSMVGCSR